MSLRVGIFMHHASPRLPLSIPSLLVNPVKEKPLAWSDGVCQIKDAVVASKPEDHCYCYQLSCLDVNELEIVSSSHVRFLHAFRL